MGVHACNASVTKERTYLQQRPSTTERANEQPRYRMRQRHVRCCTKSGLACAQRRPPRPAAMADAQAAAAPAPAGGAGAGADPSAAISDDALSARLRVVLQAADLSSTTERAIRKSLEEELGVSLNARKAFIRAHARALAAARAARRRGTHRPLRRWRRFCWSRRRRRRRPRRRRRRRTRLKGARRAGAVRQPLRRLFRRRAAPRGVHRGSLTRRRYRGKGKGKKRKTGGFPAQARPHRSASPPPPPAHQTRRARCITSA